MDRHRPAPLMADKTNAQRLIDIKAALKAAKPKEVTTLEELAGLWGTSKQRFVTKRREFAGFPDKVAVEGNTHLYRLVPCLKALLANLERPPAAMQSKIGRASGRERVCK